MNVKQIDLIRDAALKLEKIDLEMSYHLMKLAKEYRPNGKLINKKTSILEKKLLIDNGDLNIHLGVHKTASTFIQENIALSNKNGELYYTPLSNFRKKRYETSFINYLQTVDWSKKVLISDENLIGGNSSVYKTGYPYPDINKKTSDILKFFKNKELIKVFITIRPMSDFIPSQYCEYLRYNKYVDFDTFIKKCNKIEDLSWYDCLAKLIQENNDITFEIFDFEYLKNDMTIALKKLSFNNVNTVNESVKKSRSSFTFHDLYEMNPSLSNDYKNNYNKFNPFNESIKTNSKKTYFNDLEKIKKFPNVKLLREPYEQL